MAKLSAFGQAFKEARERGDAEFEFNGKKYHTRRADEGSAPAAKPAAKPAPKAEAAPQAKAASAPAAPARGESFGESVARKLPAVLGTEEQRRRAQEEPAAAPAPAPVSRRVEPERTGPSFGEFLVREMKRRLGSEETRKRMADDEVRGADGFAKGGKVASASRRGDGIAKRGKTKGRMV